jgi:hypothetical protein
MGKFSAIFSPPPRPAPAPAPAPPLPPPAPASDPEITAADKKAKEVAAARKGISGTVQAGTLGGSATTVNRPTLLGQGVG